MSYGRWRKQISRKARVEIIPLIDVMFLLLCFFVYSTMNMVVQQGIFVDLASSDSSDVLQEDQRFIIVSVDKTGQFYMNKKPISRTGLLSKLERLKQSPQKPTVVVNADKNASHGQVVVLLDLVRKSGIGQAILAVEPESRK